MRRVSFALLSCVLATVLVQGQDEDSVFSFGGDAAVVSKYIWRGQRLTNDWGLQPSATLGIKGFSFNAWENIDLTAVNEGDGLFLSENPLAPAGEHNGLQGKFSEVDYTFSFARSFEQISIDLGTIFYTFPERSASLPATTELYGSVSFDSVPFRWLLRPRCTWMWMKVGTQETQPFMSRRAPVIPFSSPTSFFLESTCRARLAL